MPPAKPNQSRKSSPLRRRWRGRPETRSARRRRNPSVQADRGEKSLRRMKVALTPSNRYSEDMSTAITISDGLAAALDRKRQEAGLDTIDAAAAELLAGAMLPDPADANSLGYSDDQLRAPIAEGEASGAAVAWDSAAVHDEVRRRFLANRPA
jgi:hypothetical protein